MQHKHSLLNKRRIYRRRSRDKEDRIQGTGGTSHGNLYDVEWDQSIVTLQVLTESLRHGEI